MHCVPLHTEIASRSIIAPNAVIVNSLRSAVSSFRSSQTICCISCPGSPIIKMVKTDPGDPGGFLKQAGNLAFGRFLTPIAEHRRRPQKSSATEQ